MIMESGLLEITRDNNVKKSKCFPMLQLTVPWFDLIVTCFTFLVLLSGLAIAISCYADATETIKDLKVLLPEARKTLQIVQNICNSPSLSHYCNPL